MCEETEPALWGYALRWTTVDEDGTPTEQCTVHQVDDPDEVGLRACAAIEIMQLAEPGIVVVVYLLIEHVERVDLLQEGREHPAVCTVFDPVDYAVVSRPSGLPNAPLDASFDPLDGVAVSIISDHDVVDAPAYLVVENGQFIAVGLEPLTTGRDETLNALRTGEPFALLVSWQNRPGYMSAGIVRYTHWDTPDHQYSGREELLQAHAHAEAVEALLIAQAAQQWESWRELYGEGPPVTFYDASGDVAEA